MWKDLDVYQQEECVQTLFDIKRMLTLMGVHIQFATFSLQQEPFYANETGLALNGMASGNQWWCYQAHILEVGEGNA